MNKLLGTAAIAVSLLVAPSQVLAGEITGNGRSIDVNGRSICAFSRNK